MGRATASQRFDLLDAARGLASLGVVFDHVAMSTVNPLAGNAIQAMTPVDIGLGAPSVAVFFVISGYCITGATESAGRRGRSFGWFMGRRAHRIWPPYVLSIGLWFFTRILKIFLGGSNDVRVSPVVWLQNLTLTQWLTDAAPLTHGRPEFFNPVYWSLCYEEQFYLVMAAIIAASLSSSMRWWIAALAVAGLVWNVFDEGGALFINLWPMFALGALVYYSPPGSAANGLRRAAWLSALVATVAIVVSRWSCDNPRHGLNWPGTFHLDAIPSAVAFIFAIALVVLRPYDQILMQSGMGRILRGLGAVSFSLYLVHYPLLSIVQTVVGKATHWKLPTLLAWTLQVLIHVMLATVFWLCCERPFVNRPDAPGQDALPIGDATLLR